MLSGMLRTFGYELELANAASYSMPSGFVAPEGYFASQQINVEWSTLKGQDRSGDARSYFEIRTSTIIRQNGGRALFHRSSEPVFLGGLSLKQHNLASITAAISDYDAIPLSKEAKAPPNEYPLSRMLRLKNESLAGSRTYTEAAADLRTPEGLEQALTEVLVERLAAPATTRQTRTTSRHAEIMRRFHTVVATAGGDVLPVPEVCAAVDVPQRTLNLCCRESLGISPKSYLHLRRMHLARRMLTRRNAFITTVTETAAHFGFYNFGRFAVQYRLLFGETPSQTLRGMAASRSPVATAYA